MGVFRVERLKVVGMYCVSCVSVIERGLRGVDGVVDVRVDFTSGEVVVTYDTGVVSLRDLVRVIRGLGYDVVKEDVSFIVDGLSSVSDEVSIEGRLRSTPGVIDCRVSHISKCVNVVFNPLSIDVEGVKKVLTSLGYRVRSVEGVVGVERELLHSELSELRRVVVISLVLSLSLATYVVVDYLGLVTSLRGFRDLIGLLLSTPVVVLGGRRFFSSAYRALRNRSANMDLLVSLGAGSAYVFSLASTLGFVESSETYYESAALIMAFILLGRYVELRMRVKTGEVVRKLLELQVKSVRVVRGGVEVEVPIDDVKVNDVVVVRSGEKIPVDGIVLDGSGYVDESTLTGESMTIELSLRGIYVSSGSACTSRVLEPSHVLLAIGRRHDEAHGSVLFKVTRYHTEDDVEYTLTQIPQAVERLRQLSPLTPLDKYPHLRKVRRS